MEELIRNGIDYFCISPGSRSTPLTTAVALNKRAKSTIIYDERGAAFHALGLARATGRPAVLICTSGTSVANYYPAVIEASVDNIPMIVLSADRPPELRGTGANQTIDQVDIFGKYPRWFHDLPCPNDQTPATEVLEIVNTVIAKSTQNVPGPVHLNCMFREPLTPSVEPFDSACTKSIVKWADSDKSYSSFTNSHNIEPRLSVFDAEEFLNFCTNKKILVTAGKLNSASEIDAVKKLAEKMQWPLFADVTSGLRLGNRSESLIAYFDQLLFSRKLSEQIKPDIVLHFGGRLVSKRFLRLLDESEVERYIHVNNSEIKLDPAHNVTERVTSGIENFCAHFNTKNPNSDYRKKLHSASQAASTIIHDTLERHIQLNEAHIAKTISETIPADSGLVLASSMPVRDMDMYGTPQNGDLRVMSNRGASGIDGTIASAVGFARGLKKQTTLVIGDLATIHDSSSFAQLGDSEFPVTVVILNNSGGGIFSYLPIADHKSVFEKYFSTPHQFNFEGLAASFRVNYKRVANQSDFITEYKKSLCNMNSTVIEVTINRDNNVKLHQDILNNIRDHFDKD